MSEKDIIRAWKDEEYRASLSEAQRAARGCGLDVVAAHDAARERVRREPQRRAARLELGVLSALVAELRLHAEGLAVEGQGPLDVGDEQGGEVLEYALIAGLIVVAAIAVIGSVGTKVLAKWTSLNSSM